MSLDALKAGVAQLSSDEQMEFIVGMLDKSSALSLGGLLTKVETRFGVKASSGGGLLPPWGGPKLPDSVVEQMEKTDFTIFLKAIDTAKKIQLIKEVRTVTGLGLKEAKELVEKAPTAVKANVPKADAEAAKKQLEAVGATIELT